MLSMASFAESMPVPLASKYAQLALKGVDREYPNKPEHVLENAADLKSPKELHPAFFGCYDWHSAVHGHWMLLRLLRTVPNLPEAAAIREVMNRHLTAENLKAEAAYFQRKVARSFERPYGWAWLLMLALELHGWDDPDARKWAANLQPLAGVIVERYLDFFPKQTYPIRSGVHANTAFGLSFAYDYALATGHKPLKALIEERAKTYYLRDTDAPAKWEPSGADFFSATLLEADLMRRILPKEEFEAWLAKFLPGATKAEPKSLFEPATVTDRKDPQLVHLDGLNLSRAWCLKHLAAALPEQSPLRKVFLESAKKHETAGSSQVASGDYAGEHWLASFAVYAWE